MRKGKRLGQAPLLVSEHQPPHQTVMVVLGTTIHEFGADRLRFTDDVPRSSVCVVAGYSWMVGPSPTMTIETRAES